MRAIDFANSYMTFFARDEGNIARIQLDAACTLTDDVTGEEKTYYLIAPCRSERMYLNTDLFHMPNYEFCGIWSSDEFLIVRTHWASVRDNREHGANRERFDDVHLDIRTFPQAQVLTDESQIVDATLANLPLVARTELREQEGGQRVMMEYPVKTMNVLRSPPRFQVDTGPVIVPDFASKSPVTIERFDLAHVVYNEFDKAELILRKPIGMGRGTENSPPTTDYSVVEILPALNEVLCATEDA